MIGHEQIVAMRRRGHAPVAVMVAVEQDDYLQMSRHWPDSTSGIAWVWVQPSDRPQRLDLRFLVGLNVQVCGLEDERVAEVAAAARQAGADRVLSFEHRKQGRGEHARFECVRVTDGERVVWPA